jgi:hypothetical protein
VVVVKGTAFFIPWDAVAPNDSFFLPTTATPEEVLAALQPVAKILGYEFQTRARCEYERYGVRVWRTY